MQWKWVLVKTGFSSELREGPNESLVGAKRNNNSFLFKHCHRRDGRNVKKSFWEGPNETKTFRKDRDQ